MGMMHVMEAIMRIDEEAVVANSERKTTIVKAHELEINDIVEIKTNQADLEKVMVDEKIHYDLGHLKNIIYIYLLEVFVTKDGLINLDELELMHVT